MDVLTPIQSQTRRIGIDMLPHRDNAENKISAGGISQKYLWRSCCMEFDSRAVVFFSQLIITCSVIAFCIYMLITHDDCETQKWYGGTLMFLVGITLPAPKISSS